MNVFDNFAELKKKRLGMTEKKSETPRHDPEPEPERLRTLGNIDTIVESQRIFNPQLPPTNPALPADQSPATETQQPKGPPAKMVHTGTAGSTDLEGRWGTPTEKK